MPAHSWERAAVVFFMILVCILAIYPASDFDTFWHLANGRWMIEHGQLATQELFSYTALGNSFDNRYWLAQIGLFLIYDIAGVNGLIIFKVIVIALIFLMLFWSARKAGAGLWATASVLALTAYALVWRMLERPELFTFLLLAWVVSVTLTVCAGQLRSVWLWSVPLCFLLWDTLHPGSAFGLAFLGIFAAGQALGNVLPSRQADARSNRGRWRKEPHRTLWLVTVVTFILQAVNPDSFLRSSGLVDIIQNNAVFREFGEFLRTPLLAGFAPFWTLALLGFLSAVWALWRRDFAQFLALGIFLYLGIAYSRGTAIYAIVAAPFLARDLTLLGNRLHSRGLGVRVTRWLAGMTMAGFVIFTVNYKFIAEPHTNSYGWGLNDRYHPIASLRFLDESNIGGRMFNLGHQGGFIAFFAPSRPIFLYNIPSSFGAVLKDMKSSGLAKRWDFNYAVIGGAYVNWRWQFPIEEWAAVYWEPAAMVMLKRTEANRSLIERHEIMYFTPFRSDAELRALAGQRDAAPQLARELADHLAWRKDDRLAVLLADMLLDPRQMLPLEQRLALLRRAQRSNTEAPSLRAALKQLEKH